MLAQSRPTRTDRVDRRHIEVIDFAKQISKYGDRWNPDMVVALTPPQARKQLTALHKAAELLAEVIEAVEYRAATLHSFNH